MSTSHLSIRTVKEANKAAGMHFFDRGAMRFFDSRILSRVYGCRYFITSERFDASHPRRYTVRMVDENGGIQTVGQFQAYPSANAARKAILALIAAEVSHAS